MPKERSILLIEDNLAIARQVVDFLEGLKRGFCLLWTVRNKTSIKRAI